MKQEKDFIDIPVFIISYNRLAYLEKLVSWLENAGYRNIHIVDNQSAYPPLQDYLRHSPHHVHHMDRNYGHLVVWECGRFDNMLTRERYVVTDCDILPGEECPSNVVEYFSGLLDRYENFTKVGFSLRVDDLPERYVMRDKVIEWEKQFWEHPLAEGLYEAAIDTTFALYRPGIFPKDPRWWRSIRTASPYTARHLSWYQDSADLTDEERFYQRQLKEMSTHWSITDPVALKEQNVKLQFEIHRLNDEIMKMKEDYWHLSKDLNAYLPTIGKRLGGLFRRK